MIYSGLLKAVKLIGIQQDKLKTSNSLHFTVQGDSMSPTYSDGDSISLHKISINDQVGINDIVVFKHPFKENCKVIKRVVRVKDGSSFFLEGDNPHIASSEDSHNFGYINRSHLIAVKKEKK